MRLTVLGSGSSGNCYLLQSEKECLVLDAGLPFLEVKKALNFDISKIVGVTVSHIHGDHAKYVKDYEMAGIPVFKPYETDMRQADYGSFHIKAFELVHDVPCFGVHISHLELGNMIYATDTEYIKYRFKNLDHLLVEANFDKHLIPHYAANREHVFHGHMEIETTLEFIRSSGTGAQNIILAHLSDKNSNERDFRERTQNVTSAAVYVATKGLEVELNKEPF